MLGSSLAGAFVAHMGPKVARKMFGLKSKLDEKAPALPEALPGEIKIERLLKYGSDTRHRYDLFLPPDTAVGPFHGVVMFHGGGFVGGFRTEMEVFARQLAERGFVVVNAEYRLLPGCSLWDTIHDGCSLLEYVQAQPQWNVDQWSIMGRSAGGHIALMTAYLSKIDVTSVISEAGPTDFTPHLWEGSIRGGFLERIAGEILFSEVSPVYVAHAKAPPTLLLHGTLDPVVPYYQSRILEVLLQAKGVPSYLCGFPGISHNVLSKIKSMDGMAWVVHWLRTHQKSVTDA